MAEDDRWWLCRVCRLAEPAHKRYAEVGDEVTVGFVKRLPDGHADGRMP